MKRKPETFTDQLHKEYNLPQKIAIDILGVLLIISSGLVGWLPGPGGLPLFLGGLGLLAKNHHWANKLLGHLKVNGNKVIKLVFRDHPLLVIIYDVLASILAILAITYLIKLENYKWLWLIIWVSCLSVGLFLGNRGRYDTFKNKYKQIFKNKKP